MSINYSPGMTTRTTVRLSPELLKAAKKKAVESGSTVTSLIEEGLRRVVYETATRKASGKPFKIKVSRAVGGLRPGFDLSDMSTIYEAEDEVFVESMKKGLK
jgi:hypothetical protein